MLFASLHQIAPIPCMDQLDQTAPISHTSEVDQTVPISCVSGNVFFELFQTLILSISFLIHKRLTPYSLTLCYFHFILTPIQLRELIVTPVENEEQVQFRNRNTNTTGLLLKAKIQRPIYSCH
jgi:hypothetical protein